MIKTVRLEKTKCVRVLLADDHPLVRAGIRTTLSAEKDITLVGEATDGYQARLLCRELAPDVLLLDLNMSGPPPAETVSYLRRWCSEIKVLVLTAYDDDAYVHSLIAAGAAGYVLKDEATEAVVRAIHAVVQGGSWFSRSVLEKIVRVQEHPVPVEAHSLTERERQILTLVAQGWSNAHIAAKLNLAEQTVRNYTSRVYAKLEVRSRAEAIVWARQRGLTGELIVQT